jgi:hypothetical protein
MMVSDATGHTTATTTADDGDSAASRARLAAAGPGQHQAVAATAAGGDLPAGCCMAYVSREPCSCCMPARPPASSALHCLSLICRGSTAQSSWLHPFLKSPRSPCGSLLPT